jgi:hypothetical protein
LIGSVLLIVAISSALLPSGAALSPATLPPRSYIVQAASAEAAAAAVRQAGGTVTARLGIINGVSAGLTEAAAALLAASPGLTLHADTPVRAADDDSHETDTRGTYLYPAAATDVQQLHTQEIWSPRSDFDDGTMRVSATEQEEYDLQGWGVTVAVVDSGLINMQHAGDWMYQDAETGTLIAEYAGRGIVYRDFVPRSGQNGNTGGQARNSVDQNGHGTHVISTIIDNRAAPLGPNAARGPVGIAPQASLMVARALDKTGAGTYGQVIAAIDWIVANRATYNVRVLNLSLYAPVSGPYWADPLNQAVMRAWQAGLVVVAAAGNGGPGPGTITAPGNVPYVITVGAVKSGRYTASGFDELAAYSSRGPTESAFVKPDVLVPASRTIAPLPSGSLLATQVQAGRLQDNADVDYGIGEPSHGSKYYQLSGTSMAAAEVSGIAALIVQAHPTLTNDEVKYRLMATARPARDAQTGQFLYSPWEQGAGLVDAPAAVLGEITGTANNGLDVTQDLTTNTHYWGYTSWDPATGQFSLPVEDSTTRVWDGTTGVWDGTTRVWDGTTRVWDGTTRVWDGTTRVWDGSLATTWTGNAALWAGSNRAWAAAPSAALSAATAQILLNEP